MLAYPGRSFGQLYHRMLKANQLLTGKVNLSDHEIDVADISVPVLIFGGNTDGIAPIKAVQALVPLLKGAQEVRFEIVPGGHLGMLTGRAARATTWVIMDEWIKQHSTAEDRAPTPAARKAAAKKAARRTAQKRTQKAGQQTQKEPRKRTAKAAPATAADRKKPAPRAAKPVAEVAPDRSAIGSNPDRRFASASSRNLTRKS
jgi:polyhydroxyalkanoate synthase